MSTFISAGGGATDIALRSLKATKLGGPSTSSKNWCINWWFSGCHQRLNWWINNWWINWWLACIKSQSLIFERKVWSSVHADPDEKKLPVQRTADRCRLRQKATLKASPCSGGYSTVAMDPDSWWLRPFCWPFVSYFWMNCDDLTSWRRYRDRRDSWLTRSWTRGSQHNPRKKTGFNAWGKRNTKQNTRESDNLCKYYCSNWTYLVFKNHWTSDLSINQSK